MYMDNPPENQNSNEVISPPADSTQSSTQMKSKLRKVIELAISSIVLFVCIWYPTQFLCLTDNVSQGKTCLTVQTNLVFTVVLILFAFNLIRIYKNVPLGSKQSVPENTESSSQNNKRKTDLAWGIAFCIVPILLVFLYATGISKYIEPDSLVTNIFNVIYFSILPLIFIGIGLVVRSQRTK